VCLVVSGRLLPDNDSFLGRSFIPIPLFLQTPMASLFNIIRACIYATVLVFTLICLAMAGHFQSVLVPSDLTRFVPFAIFVCSASMLIFIVLLAFSFLFRERNPISTRTELACLGLTGIFWLILGAFLVLSDSKAAEVECFSADPPCHCQITLLTSIPTNIKPCIVSS